MSARIKLNQFFIGVSALIATVIGLLTKSIVVFLVCFGGLVACMLHDGDIRLKGKRKR